MQSWGHTHLWDTRAQPEAMPQDLSLCSCTLSDINIELQHRDSHNNVTRMKYLKKWKLSSLQTMAIWWLVGFNH